VEMAPRSFGTFSSNTDILSATGSIACRLRNELLHGDLINLKNVGILMSDELVAFVEADATCQSPNK
jgi:hypothetical protein